MEWPAHLSIVGGGGVSLREIKIRSRERESYSI